MSHIAKWWLLASALLCVAGALVHLAISFGGPAWYWYWGAPQGLVAMAEAGLARPIVTCVVIACILLFFAVCAFSALGFVRRLPALRWVLGIIGVGLVAHGVWLPIAAAKDPSALTTTCGRCDSLNGFVVAMSAFCVFIAWATCSGHGVKTWLFAQPVHPLGGLPAAGLRRQTET